MDEVVRKVAALGLPGVLLAIAMGATGLTGGAAIAAGLAAYTEQGPTLITMQGNRRCMPAGIRSRLPSPWMQPHRRWSDSRRAIYPTAALRSGLVTFPIAFRGRASTSFRDFGIL